MREAAALCAALAVWILAAPDLSFLRPPRRLSRALAAVRGRTSPLPAPPSRRRWTRLGLLWHAAGALEALAPARYREKTLALLEGLGEAPHVTVRDVLAAKVGCAALAAAYTLAWLALYPSPALGLLALPMTAVAFLLPDRRLESRFRRRQEDIRRELPSVLSSLAIATEAGLGLTQALAEVVRTRRGALAQELGHALEAIRLGAPQAEALERVAERVRVPELTGALAGLVQSLEKGSAQVAETLREQSLDAWARRRRRAEALAQQVSLRLFFPLLLFTFPALVIFLLGPAALSLVEFFRQSP